MSPNAQSKSIKRMAWSAFALVVLLALWYAFRPEKLFVNQRVNEPPPASLAQTVPLYTGSFQSGARATSGRATVYRESDGTRVLTLSNFSAPPEATLQVLLVDTNAANDPNLGSSDGHQRRIGEIKTGLTELSYPLPGDIDVNRWNSVVIYADSLHAVFATARLDAF
jgi:hypothetical protein